MAEQLEKYVEENTYNDPSVSGGVSEHEHEVSHKTMNAGDWSMSLKIYHTAIPCFLSFLV